MPVQILVATRKYSDYILYPNLTETAAQAAMPTKSYGNFGLDPHKGPGIFQMDIYLFKTS